MLKLKPDTRPVLLYGAGLFILTLQSNLAFEKNTYKFGRVDEGEEVLMKFPFKNNGNIPVIFQNYKVECPCTKVQYPKHPVAPGNTDTVVVIFDTKHKLGYQERTIDLQTNLGHYMLKFKGVVKAGRETKNAYRNSH